MVKVPDWHKDHTTQAYELDGKEWSIARLVELSKKLEVFEAPLRAMDIRYNFNWSMLDAVMHVQAVLDADLSYPIILSAEGVIFDGRHRVMKALLEGRDTVKAVRFDENPIPCRYVDK